MKDEPIVMMDSDEAASFKTVTGWVSRDGFFYGEDERTARYAGCTHRACEQCGAPTLKHWIKCDDCRLVQDVARFMALPVEPWDGEPLCIFDDDTYFFDADEDELAEYADEHSIAPENLRLVKCEPIYAEEQDPNDVYQDETPEDGEVPDYVAVAFAALNEALRQKTEPLCWRATKVRVDVADLVRARLQVPA